jgi:Protein of unknown function (DUF3307)
MAATIWVIKLILSHLITDFILQPNSWIEQRKQKHFAASTLYIHCLVTAVAAWAIIGWQYWLVAIIIFISHAIIDGWKSYQKTTNSYFIIDQLLHVLIIILCWYATFYTSLPINKNWIELQTNIFFWKAITGATFVTLPAAILIAQLTKKWREKIDDADTLANAGKWIGIIERIIILILVLKNEYSSIGLLIAAKSIIRFNEKDRPEVKTEYLVIGTLISFILAMLTGLLIKM